ncbi:hypothetical protein PDJ95_29970 [Bacillus cereus]|nr:hypothetical protein [Bacillus cereus]
MRNMNKILTGALTLAMFAGSLPGTALAADNSDPVTKNGERLKYNTPYYLKDKTLPNKGGITVEPYLFTDYPLFSNSPTDNGDPIIFENPDGTDGFIKSGEDLTIKATKVIDSGAQYWSFSNRDNSVYLGKSPQNHRLYGSSKDNSIGIGSVNYGRSSTDISTRFVYYKGADTDKAWLTASYRAAEVDDWHSPVLNIEEIKTPFELIEVSE